MKFASVHFVLFSGVVILSCCFGQSQSIDPHHKFDFLIFTQHWPVTVCDEWKEHNDKHECQLPPNTDTWTIHGIWPSVKGSMGPFFCNSSWVFDPTKVKSIEDDLETKWVNIEKDTPENGLWEHEWSKHGTCAAVLPQLSDELKYFSQGLEWLSKYSMDKILLDNQIVPSSEKLYTVQTINYAIKSVLKYNPIIECREDHKVNYLFEIRLCFDKQLNLMDCDGATTYTSIEVNNDNIVTNCDPSKGILYPDKVKNSLNMVQLYRLLSWVQWFTL